jgi:hypothetical protein
LGFLLLTHVYEIVFVLITTRRKAGDECLLLAGHQWLTPIIRATWEAEMGRMEIQGQPRQIVLKTSSPK